VFIAETPQGSIEARNVIAATGPFQKPVIPKLVADEPGLTQIHSARYRNPALLPQGAVLVIGAGSSGVQIADELSRAGRKVYLAVGAHDRPPRRYRGKDFVWWLGALGMWDAKALSPNMAHVTIAVSGARGGHTVDFRDLAETGITLLGRAERFGNGVLHFAPDLAARIAEGDANTVAMLDAADAYIAREGLDFPEEPAARALGELPACATEPLLALNLREAGVTSIVWATGYALDFGWLKLDAFDEQGRPIHERGVSVVPGLYFLGLSWLSRRASAFIWGVWHDAAYVAQHIAAREG
jgi:putative flavoprotein involved in K+ transport